MSLDTNANHWQHIDTTSPHFVVSFSSGASSAATTEIILKTFGSDNVTIVFCDTLVEDEDNYRFMIDCENRWMREYGADPIVKLSIGATPDDIAEWENIIPNQKIAPCTKRLKIFPFMTYLHYLADGSYAHEVSRMLLNKHDWGFYMRRRVARGLYNATKSVIRKRLAPNNFIIAIGMADHEKGRHAAPRRNYKSIGATDVVYPLMWNGTIEKPKQFVADLGLTLPRMYDVTERVNNAIDGYKAIEGAGHSHANCGSQGCVKLGKREWALIYFYDKDLFLKRARWERMMQGISPLHANYAFLRHTENGVTRAYTLFELEQEILNLAKNKSQKQLVNWNLELDILALEDDMQGCARECGASWQDEDEKEYVQLPLFEAVG